MIWWAETFHLLDTLFNCYYALRWRHNERDIVSHHQPQDCLLNRLFRRRSTQTSKLRVTGLCVGNSPGPVNSPHKWAVTREMFPFDDVIMASTKAYGCSIPPSNIAAIKISISDATWFDYDTHLSSNSSKRKLLPEYANKDMFIMFRRNPYKLGLSDEKVHRRTLWRGTVRNETHGSR